MTEERSRETPQRVRALRVASIFGPRGVAKLLRSATACGEMGTPQPHQACAWLLAIFRKLTAPWHTRVSQQSPRQRARQRGRLRRALGFPRHSIGCRYILPALRILETRRAGGAGIPFPRILYFGLLPFVSRNTRASEFRQYRRLVGGGPSGKTCPRCPPQRAHRISVRTMP